MALLLHLIVLLSPETERLLLGPNPFFRYEGMRRAVRENDNELLLAASRSDYWDARRFAAEGLGLNTPHRLLKDPVAVVREAAVRALDVRAPEPILIELLADPDDAVRAEAAWAMRAASSRRRLQPLLRDPSPTVRIAALAATGNSSRLRTLALKGDLGTQVMALAALGRIGGASEGAFLLGRFRKVLAAASKERSPLYLRAAPSPDIALARAVGDLARRGILAGGKPMAVQLRKLVATQNLQRAGGVLVAEAVAGARDAESARLVLDAQLKMRRTSKLPAAYLDPSLRGILHIFSREPWPELAPLLLPFLDSTSPTVRAEVARALSGNAARPALRDRAAAVRAIACANVGSVKPLLGMLADESPIVVAAAASALGRLGDAAAAPELEARLTHRDSGVRRAVIGAFLRIDYPGRADALRAVALKDGVDRVRAAAASAIVFLELEEAVLPAAIGQLASEHRLERERAIALIHALTTARFDYNPARPDRGAAMWSEWLKRKRAKEKKSGGFRYHVEDLRRRGIDLVLVVDATGSMAGLIQSTKRKMEAVVAGLRLVVPDLRARVVFYRDRGDTFLTVGSPLTHDPRVLEDFIASVPASGGGDAPEAVLAGLRDGIEKTEWRGKPQKIVVLFGDSPPHADDLVLLQAICKEFKGVIHAVDVGNYGHGGVKKVMTAYRDIAEWGKGRAIALADENDLLRNLLVLTLGARFRVAVETLFGL